MQLARREAGQDLAGRRSGGLPGDVDRRRCREKFCVGRGTPGSPHATSAASCLQDGGPRAALEGHGMAGAPGYQLIQGSGHWPWSWGTGSVRLLQLWPQDPLGAMAWRGLLALR